MSQDTTLKGVLIAFVCFVAYAISDASVKLIDGRVPPLEAAFFGSCFGLIAVPFLLKRGDRWSDLVRTTNRPLWLLRFVCSAIGTVGSIIAFTELSMAEAFSLIFLLPSFATILSVIFLKEKVGPRRWSAVVIGFVGVLIVLRPGFRELSFGHLTALVSGFTGAVSIVIYRAVGPAEKSVSLYGAGFLGSLLISGALMAPGFVWPTPHDFSLLASFGILATVGNVLLMVASFYASAAVVGPIQYSQMIWAVLFGYVLFGDRLDLPMFAGIVLIVGSGLLTVIRERQRGVPLPPSLAAAPQAALSAEPEAPADLDRQG